ncbi:MAG: DUF2851 family protein [Flavobacteriales bacterium]
MQEELLQFIWKEGLFNSNALQTTTGVSLFFENRGQVNSISGPDFSEAKIRIDDTLWAGSVEIHLRSSDWFRHGHEKDKAYDNVILHVVFENDVEVQNSKGEIIPAFELKGRVPSTILAKYDYLKSTKNRIACADHVQDYPQLKFRMWLQRILVSRLDRKSRDIELIHNHSNADWLQTFYVLFAGYLGQNTNKLPFQELARKLPFAILSKHADNSLQLEAMLFGVADLLSKEARHDYEAELKREFDFLSRKYNLESIKQLWKFGGIRPDAFPFRRVALLASLVPFIQWSCDQVLSTNLKSIRWPEIPPHEFWDHHYTFNKVSSKSSPIAISAGLQQLLGINVIVPFAFFYGRATGNEAFIDSAISFLESIDPEDNQHVKSWRSLNFRASNAADTQALIELTTQYCVHKNCVICSVGKSIISKQ